LSRELVDLQNDCYFHLISVLKLRIGAEIIVFNQFHGEWLCTLESITKYSVIVQKKHLLRNYQTGQQKKIGLAFCPIKQHNTNLIIEKCTELGATDFWPITTEFTNHTIRVEKLESIARGAVEQCGRLDLPKLHKETAFNDFIVTLPEEFLWISALERSGYQAISAIDTTNKNCGFIVGPEGGFSEIEKNLLLTLTLPVSLSINILKSETAAIACLAMIGANSS
jgi:16S rRNA (uracil1498-N3)-methyltransferase